MANENTGDPPAGLTNDERRRFETLAKSPQPQVRVDVDELLELYREVSRLRLRNTELLFARSHPEGPTDATLLSLARVFGERALTDTRIRHACESMGLVVLGEVAALDPEDLLGRQNFGRKCLARVEEVLAAHGLKLRGR